MSFEAVPKPSAIVMDIEGTVVDVDFVWKSLFPAIEVNMSRFVSETYDWPQTKELIKMLRQLLESGSVPGMPAIAWKGTRAERVRSIKDSVIWLMRKKLRKNTPTVLKSIVLLCWLWMYEKNVFKAQVYEDVSIALHNWKVKSRIKLYTFSSGLIPAQQLLFVKTNHGNLFHLIDQFFDASIGDKTDSKSYTSIANTIGVSAKDILFITDSSKEELAAHGAGLRTVLIRREGTLGKYEDVNDFMEIKFT